MSKIRPSTVAIASVRKKNVIAVRLICSNTVEEKIMVIQQHKAKLAGDLILEVDGFFGSLGKEGLLGILAAGMKFVKQILHKIVHQTTSNRNRQTYYKNTWSNPDQNGLVAGRSHFI